METANFRGMRLFLPSVTVAAILSILSAPVAAQTVTVDAGEGAAASRPLRGTSGLYGSCLLRGRPVHDFKLKDVVSGRMTTFLETARREYTLLYFLNATSPGALENLRNLERLRDRYPDLISLVAIFVAPETDEDVLDILVSHRLYPDRALHDPSLHQPRCYGLKGSSALHVVGPAGEIIFTVSSKRPVDLAAFHARIDKVLSMGQDGSSDFASARDVYEDAMRWLREGKRGMALFYLERVLELQPHLYTVNCQMADICRDLKMRRQAARYYSRYIGADTDAYDLVGVRQSLRSLAAMAPVDAAE